MIPAGYVDSIVAWATRPDLSDADRATRQTQLLTLHDSLMTGEATAKPSRTLISGTLNGKTFAWAPDITTAEKLVVITAVLGRLGLLAPPAVRPKISYGDFTGISR